MASTTLTIAVGVGSRGNVCARQRQAWLAAGWTGARAASSYQHYSRMCILVVGVVVASQTGISTGMCHYCSASYPTRRSPQRYSLVVHDQVRGGVLSRTTSESASFVRSRFQIVGGFREFPQNCFLLRYERQRLRMRNSARYCCRTQLRVIL